MSQGAAFRVRSRYCRAINKDTLPAVIAAHSESLALQEVIHCEYTLASVAPSTKESGLRMTRQCIPCSCTMTHMHLHYFTEFTWSIDKKYEAELLPRQFEGLSTRTALHTNDAYKHLLKFSILQRLLTYLPPREPGSHTRTVQRPLHISYTSHTL